MCSRACDTFNSIIPVFPRFGFPEVELGILPAWCGTQRLPRLTSLELALDLIPTGRRMKVPEAVKHGVVDKVRLGKLNAPAVQTT